MNIKEEIEAILFATGRLVSFEEISNLLSITLEDIDKIISELKLKYNENNSGVILLELNNGVQLVSNKKCFNIVSKFIENSKKQNLSSTSMEVLSIIAYNKDITKSEIEKIRGINSDSQVSRLLEYGLIEETSRLNLPGRPATFGVTNEFLKCMGIKDINELPDYEEIKNSKEFEEIEE